MHNARRTADLNRDIARYLSPLVWSFGRWSVLLCMVLFTGMSGAWAADVQLQNIQVTGNTVPASSSYVVTGLKVTATVVTIPGTEDVRSPSMDAAYTTNNALTLEADTVSYLETNKFVEATGNVVVVYRAYRVSADQTEVDIASNQLKVRQGFVMQRNEQRFEGKYLDYDLAQDRGEARDISMSFGGAYVKGKKIEIGKEKILIDDAGFTRCELEDPCYHFQARKLTIYPEWNQMVARDAWFYAGRVPVMYVPIYIIDRNSRQYSDVIPEFGENRTEGRYVKAKIGYFENEKIQGTYDIQYLEKLWYRVGITNRYVWDDVSVGNIRLHYIGEKDWFTGGLTHRTLLGVASKRSEQRIEDFFSGIMPPSNDEYPEMVFDLSRREILGDQFVSYLPMLSLNSPQYPLLQTSWGWDTSLSVADILEELAREESIDDEDYPAGYEQRFRRQRWLIRTMSTYDVMPLGALSGEFAYDKSGYYDGAYLNGFWYRLYTTWNVGRRISFWDYSLGYSHIFDEGGFSPFVFDKFNLSTKDEVSVGLGLWFNDMHRLGYRMDYAVNEQEVRNEDISLDMRLHHWQVSLIFRTKLLQTYFSVSLL